MIVVFFDRGLSRSGFRVEDVNALVRSASRDQLAVRAERHGINRSFGGGERLKLPAAGRVPQPHGGIDPGRNNQCSVRTDVERRHRSLMSGQRNKLLARFRIPHSDRAVDAARGKPFAIGSKLDRVNSAAMSGQSPHGGRRDVAPAVQSFLIAAHQQVTTVRSKPRDTHTLCRRHFLLKLAFRDAVNSDRFVGASHDEFQIIGAVFNAPHRSRHRDRLQ